MTLCAADSSLCGCHNDPLDQLWGLYQNNQQIGHQEFLSLVQDAMNSNIAWVFDNTPVYEFVSGECWMTPVNDGVPDTAARTITDNQECCGASNGNADLAAACTSAPPGPEAAAFSLCDINPIDGQLDL